MNPPHQTTEHHKHHRELRPDPLPLDNTLEPSELVTLDNPDVLYDETPHAEDDDELDLHGEDSYIYGEDYEEDTNVEVYAAVELPTPEYNPEAEITEERFKGKNEIANCFAYSRKTGEQIGEIELDDVRRELTNNNVFVWVGLHDPSIETIREVQEAFDLHELAIEDAFAEHQRAKVESYGTDSVFVVVRTAKLTENTIRYGTTAIFMGKQYIITIRQGASHSYSSVREFCHRRPEKLRLGPIFVLHAICLLYTSDAADEEDSVDFVGLRNIKKKKKKLFFFFFKQKTAYEM